MRDKAEREERLAALKANLSANVNVVETVMETLDRNREELDSLVQSHSSKTILVYKRIKDMAGTVICKESGIPGRVGDALMGGLEEEVRISRTVSRFNMI